MPRLPPAPGHRALLSQFLRFGMVGTVVFLVDSAVLYALRGALGLYAARAASFLAAVTVSWMLNRSWTFRGTPRRGSLVQQWLLFVAANSSGAALNLGIYVALVAAVGFCAANPVVAVGAGAVAGMFVNFALSRRVVFR